MIFWNAKILKVVIRFWILKNESSIRLRFSVYRLGADYELFIGPFYILFAIA